MSKPRSSTIDVAYIVYRCVSPKEAATLLRNLFIDFHAPLRLACMNQSCTTNTMTRHVDHLILRTAMHKAVDVLNIRLAMHAWTLQTMTHTLAANGN
jgi:hypothetical protein